MYPIKNHLLNSITYDKNGAYTQRWTRKTKYFVIRRSNSTEMKAQIVHKNDKDEYFSKQRDGRSYTDVHTAASDMYTVERYYHPNKNILSLGNLVFQVKQAKRTNSGHIYYRSKEILQKSSFHTITWKVLNGDRPYIRTSKTISH